MVRALVSEPRSASVGYPRGTQHTYLNRPNCRKGYLTGLGKVRREDEEIDTIFNKAGPKKIEVASTSLPSDLKGLGDDFIFVYSLVCQKTPSLYYTPVEEDILFNI